MQAAINEDAANFAKQRQSANNEKPATDDTKKIESKEPDLVEKWEGSIGGGIGSLDITKVSNGLYGKLAVGAPGCAGGLEGQVIENDDLIVVESNPDKSVDNACIVLFTKEGSHITKESDEGNCTYFHGGQCDFSDPRMVQTR